MRLHLQRLTVACLALCLNSAAARAADWPHFRGPEWDGKSAETGFKKQWTAPIPVEWERELGAAFSSFAVVGGRLYTGGTRDGMQTLVCLDANTGDEIWTRPLESEYKEAQGGDGPRATPTVADGRVYMLGALGRLLCVDANDGKEIWARQLKHRPTWGYSASVLIEGELAIVSAGESDGGLLALNRLDGKEIWKASDDVAGYATPYAFALGDKRYIVGFLGRSAIVVEAATGRIVWKTEWRTSFDVNASAPIFADGKLFLSSGYGHGCAQYEVKPNADGLDVRPVWDSRNLRNKFQSCILHDGYLYTSDEKGLRCVSWNRADKLWELPRSRHGTVLLADGNLFFLTEDGELQIGPATPQGWKPTTKQSVLDGRCWTLSVLSDGRLYVRNLTKVKCLDLR